MDNLSTLQRILCFFGVMFVSIVFGYSVAVIWNAIHDALDHLKYNHRVKHRFDGQPTAKCWCKDCSLHGRSGQCQLPGMTRYTPDNGFCYEAEPKRK